MLHRFYLSQYCVLSFTVICLECSWALFDMGFGSYVTVCFQDFLQRASLR